MRLELPSALVFDFTANVEMGNDRDETGITFDLSRLTKARAIVKS